MKTSANLSRQNYWPVRALIACAAMELLLLGCSAAQAQEQQVELEPLPPEVATDFDQRLTDIALQNVDVEHLQGRIDLTEGLLVQVLEIRRDRIWTSMFRDTLRLARDVANRRDDGLDVSIYEDLLVGQLSERAPEAIVAIQRMRSRVVFPTEEAPPQEFVITDQRLFKNVREVDDLYGALIDYVEIAERFDLDSSPARNFMTGSLTDTAANRSVFLELAISDVQTLRESVATLPNNTELTDWLSAAEARVRMTAAAMQEMITLMNALDLDTRQYRQQVLTVTGEITTDVLDVGIMASLIKEWSIMIGGLVASEGPRLLFRLLLVIFILFVFFQFAKLVQKGVERGLSASKLQISHLLRRMILSTVRNLVVIFGILIAISQLGISLGPLLAGLGIAGFIIGFALQDTLSNFASHDPAVPAVRRWRRS
jgi:small conductance mechanosensitive channel